jgi:hypothetical protein
LDVSTLRHQGGLSRAEVFDELQVARIWIALDIEFRLNMVVKVVAILGGNVAFIGSGMHGNSLGTVSFGVQRKLQYVRCLTSTCIAQGCDFIDIHAESGHGTIIELQKYETFKEFSILRPL